MIKNNSLLIVESELYNFFGLKVSQVSIEDFWIPNNSIILILEKFDISFYEKNYSLAHDEMRDLLEHENDNIVKFHVTRSIFPMDKHLIIKTMNQEEILFQSETILFDNCRIL